MSELSELSLLDNIKDYLKIDANDIVNRVCMHFDS